MLCGFQHCLFRLFTNSPCCTKNVVKQAIPPTTMLIQSVHRLPNLSIDGHRNKYVGSSTIPAKKKLRNSSPPKTGAQYDKPTQTLVLVNQMKVMMMVFFRKLGVLKRSRMPYLRVFDLAMSWFCFSVWYFRWRLTMQFAGRDLPLILCNNKQTYVSKMGHIISFFMKLVLFPYCSVARQWCYPNAVKGVYLILLLARPFAQAQCN